jgi:hypothetical protein
MSFLRRFVRRLLRGKRSFPYAIRENLERLPMTARSGSLRGSVIEIIVLLKEAAIWNNSVWNVLFLFLPKDLLFSACF